MKLIRQGRYSPAWAGTTEQRSEAYKGRPTKGHSLCRPATNNLPTTYKGTLTQLQSECPFAKGECPFAEGGYALLDWQVSLRGA